MYTLASRKFLQILLVLLLCVLILSAYTFWTLVAFQKEFNTTSVVYAQPHTSLENIFNTLIASDDAFANHTESIAKTKAGGVELTREAQVISSDAIFTIQFVTTVLSEGASNEVTKYVLLTVVSVNGDGRVPVMSYADLDVDGTVDIVYSDGETVVEESEGLASQEGYSVALDRLADVALEVI